MREAGKKAAAERALSLVKPDAIIGVGSGSTVRYFIEALATRAGDIEAAVASSLQTERLLKASGIPVVPLSSINELPLYIDGADAIDAQGVCLKGGGAAHTQEKILADAAKIFVCIVDAHKVYDRLPDHVPLTIEVLAQARSQVAKYCVAMGAQPVYRERCITDQGHQILDVFGFDFTKLAELDVVINQWPGVVAHGLFYKQKADYVIIGQEDGTSLIRDVSSC